MGYERFKLLAYEDKLRKDFKDGKISEEVLEENLAAIKEQFAKLSSRW
jgi:hypothetical protein